jgi:translation elongation factor EF-Ts
VPQAELRKLEGTAAGSFFQGCKKALEQNQETVAKAPAALDKKGVEGLIIVHLTHAADNFSIK